MNSPGGSDLPETPSKPGEFYIIQTQTGWQRTLKAFAKWCVPEKWSRVLDVGCGPGIFPAMLASEGCQAFGVDLDPQSFSQSPLHQQVAVADAANLPFPEGSFDLVTASNLLFLLADPVDILREFVRLLSTSGQVALLNPSEKLSTQAAILLADQRKLDRHSRESLLNWASMAEKHARWDEPSIERLFQSAGLRLVESRLHMGPGFARFVRGDPFS